MPEPREHADHRNWVESIARWIPGFRGYLEKEYRRESDTLQRDWMVDRLDRSKRGIERCTREWADAGQIKILPQCDRLRGRIDKLSSRIRGAMKGYSGFFDLVRINEEVLDRIYEFDSGLLDQIDGYANSVEQLGKAENPAEAIQGLLARAEEYEDLWDQRENILKGLD
ncbi:MAG: hypothetical protein N2C12_05290 [Planctomycetales bacterium]